MRSSITHTAKFIESHGVNKSTKKCRVCKVEKDKTDFPRDHSRVDGRYPDCNSCKNIYLKKNLERQREVVKRYAKRNPEKTRAHQKVGYAVKCGKIIKPKNCQNCGNETKRIEGHHWHGYDDQHALDVQWLCHTCHMEADLRYNAEVIKQQP